MRQSQVRQPQSLVRRFFKTRLKPIWTTNHNSYIIPRQLPRLKPLGQADGGDVATTFVQSHDVSTARDCRPNTRLFSQQQCVKCFGRARLSLDRLQFDLDFRREAFGVVVVGSLRPVWHF